MPQVEQPTPSPTLSIGLYKSPAREEVFVGLLPTAEISRD
jgi:hypothetical protein